MNEPRHIRSCRFSGISRYAAVAGVGVLSVLIVSGCLPSRTAYFEQVSEQQRSDFDETSEAIPAESFEKASRKDLARISGKLPIEDAVRYALVMNPGLEAVLKNRIEAEGRKMEAYAEVLPKLNLEAGYTRMGKLQTVTLANRSFQVGEHDNYSVSARLTQPLYKGGRMFIAQRASRLFSYLQDETVRAQVQDVIYRVVRAYYDALLAEQLIKVQESALDSARAHLQAVKSRHKQGAATRYDVLRARVEVSNFTSSLIEQKNRLDTAKANLFRVMGVSQRSKAALASEFVFEKSRPTFRSAAQTALANRPDLYQAQLNVDLQKQALQRAYSRYFPTVNAFFQDEWTRPDPFQSAQKWDDQWMTGIQLTWPLFDGLAREGKIVQARAKLEKNRKRRQAARERALLQVQNALDQLHNAVELVQSQRLNVQRAEEARELVRAGYKQGVNTEVEVLDATAALTRAKGNYYQALHKYTIARLDLKNAKGVLGPPPASTTSPAEIDVSSVFPLENEMDVTENLQDEQSGEE